MIGEKTDFTAAKDAQDSSAAKLTRERSTIEFPYVPLEAGLEVARAIYARCGFGSCDQDELAVEMGQTLSGAFRQKTGAAKTFGLVEKDGRSAFRLTDLGKRIVAPETERAAKVDAFLAVPLYQQVYEKFRGHNLPPLKALEREMATLGVGNKQTDRARQAFERSAHYAGFFDSGSDRLVRPRLDGGTPQKPDEQRPPPVDTGGEMPIGGGGGDDGAPPNKLDPIIRGLVDKLPPSGAIWPKSKRKLWLQILENSLEFVYENDDKDGNDDLI